jgi:hypothetical protein
VEVLAATRDLIIIFVALISLAANVLLIVLGWRLWTLVKSLKAEIDPIISSVNRTSETLRGTTTLVGDVVVGPVAKVAAMSVAAQTLVRSLTTIARGGRRV